MSCNTHHTHHPQRCSLYCIVPPHIFSQLAEHGSPVQQERAQRALGNSGQFRGERQQLSELIVRRGARIAEGGKQRTVYDAQFQTTLPGEKVRGEGEPATGDTAVDEAYDGSGETYNFFYDIYSRNSIDDRGMPLISTVHYGQGFDNAFWNSRQMTYGDGDEDLPEAERVFNRFTIALDIIGHELTHGVVEHEAGLVYRDQPGAMNESFADVFGALVKQRKLNQTAAEADWLIGAGLFTANVNAKGIRSMKAPGTAYDDPQLGTDPQPAHMKDIYKGSGDNGGVHINSGIPNHAFYITALELGGNAWEKAGRIWYVTLKDKLGPSSQFQEAAAQTYLVAGELFGANSLEQQAVRKGWQTVGLDVVETAPKPQPPSPGCQGATAAALLATFSRSIGG